MARGRDVRRDEASGERRSLLQLRGCLRCVNFTALEFQWNRDERLVGTAAPKQHVVTAFTCYSVRRKRSIRIHDDPRRGDVIQGHATPVSPAPVAKVSFADS